MSVLPGAGVPRSDARPGSRDIDALAHELNNVLTVLVGGIALTEPRLAGDASATKLFAHMREAAYRGSALVRELLITHGETHAETRGIEPLFAIGDDAAQDLVAGRALPQRRILVVEDDPDVAEVAVAVLEGLGHAVALAGNAPEALSCLQAASYDLVFSDIVMPGGMTGVELAETMRTAYPGIPVLLATGYSAAAVGSAAARFPLLAKPYSVRELTSRVALLLADATGHQG